ncbi:MAG: metal-sensitive transcriptional regulator [Bacillota bacterium]
MVELVSVYEARRVDLLQRLRKVEGQVRGVQKMIGDGRACVDVLTQLAAISEGIKKVSMLVSECHVKGRVNEALSGNGPDDVADELVQVLFKFTR